MLVLSEKGEQVVNTSKTRFFPFAQLIIGLLNFPFCKNLEHLGSLEIGLKFGEVKVPLMTMFEACGALESRLWGILWPSSDQTLGTPGHN